MHIWPGFALVLTTGLSMLSSASATADLADTPAARVLLWRRHFPGILATADEHNVHLPNLARRAAELKHELGPQPEKTLVTVRVARLSANDLNDKFTCDRTVAELVRSLRALADHFAPRGRAAVLAALRLTLGEDGPAARDRAIALVRYALWSEGWVDPHQAFHTPIVDHLRVLRVPESFKEAFTRLTSELRLTGRENHAARVALDRLRKRVPGPLFDHLSRHLEFLRQTVVLSQMHPDLALAKGYFAADCSSRECLGYPLAPTEAVFAVTDGNFEIRGLAAVTNALSGGRPTLYANTVGGANMNPEHVHLTLVGLNHLTARNQSLSLPTAAVLHDNRVSDALYQALESYTQNRPLETLTYLDTSVRNVIEGFSLSPYDAMETHRRAHVMSPAALFDPDLHVTVEAGSSFDLGPEPPPRFTELIEAMLELLSVYRFEMARDLWTQAGRPLSEATRMIDALTNVKGLGPGAHLDEVRALLRSFDLDAAAVDAILARGENTPAERLLATGRLFANEALDPETRAETFQKIVEATNLRPRILRIPAFKAWLLRLNRAVKREFLLMALRTRQRNPGPSNVPANLGLIAHLSTDGNLARSAQRASEFGISPGMVIEIANLIAHGTNAVNEPKVDFAIAGDMAEGLRGTRTAAEFVELFERFALNPRRRSPAYQALGATVDHLASLHPREAHVARLNAHFEGAAPIVTLTKFYARFFYDARAFLTAGEALLADAGETTAVLVQAALRRRVADVLRTQPSPAQVRKFRQLTASPGGEADRWVVRRALAFFPRTWRDVRALVRADAETIDQSLYLEGREHLDRLTDAFETSHDDAGPGDPRVRQLESEVRRHALLRRAETAERWIQIMSECEPAPLTTAQVKRFVALEPSVEQFRRIILLSGAIAGYGPAGAAVVKSLADLVEIARPLRLPNHDQRVIRHEMLDLVAAVVTDPRRTFALSELDLDHLTSLVGLDILRELLPPVTNVGPCEMNFTSTEVRAKP